MSFLAVDGLRGLGAHGVRGGSTLEADAIAMGAQPGELPRLCSEGNLLACELAKLPEPTSKELAYAERWMEADAEHQRSGIDRKRRESGLEAAEVAAAKAVDPRLALSYVQPARPAPAPAPRPKVQRPVPRQVPTRVIRTGVSTPVVLGVVLAVVGVTSLALILGKR